MASETSQHKLPDTAEDDQSFRHHIVWLDNSLNNSKTSKRKVEQLREIDPEMRSFTSEKECVNYIRQQNDRNLISYILFIISGALCRPIIPEIHDCTCILAFFIYCGNVDSHKDVRFPKLLAIHSDLYELMDSIEICIQKHNDTTDFSVLHSDNCVHSDSDGQHSIRNLKQDVAKFLWFNHMHKFMVSLESDDDKAAKEAMINHCRGKYAENSVMQKKIDTFRAQSLADNKENAILWYTENCFIHSCTNRVLRIENISQIYCYRYFIKILCQQLKKQHKKFIQDYRENQITELHLYRGQQLKLYDINFLKQNKNILISLNGFVSTTTDKVVAMVFIRQRRQEGLEPVLFNIDVDMTREHGVAFADISKLSKFDEEKEILLSIGSVFRVKSVTLDELEQVYIIHLKLSEDNQMAVNEYIDQTYAIDAGPAKKQILFGKLLFEMGETEAALNYFLDSLDRLSNNDSHLRATYLNNLGVCYNEMRKRDEALRYYKEALRIYEETKYEQGIGACRHNIASIYHAQGNHRKAYQEALVALEYRQERPIERASTLDLIGSIQLHLPDIEAAQNSFRDALRLRQRCWSKNNPNHPDIGMSYQNLGRVNSRERQYVDAAANYSRAAKILLHNYPETHTLVREVTQLLEETKRKLN